MASPLRLQTLLLLLLAFSSAKTYAGRNQFFSKTVREQQPTEETPTTTGAPAAGEKERVPAALPSQAHGGYGLYGSGPDRFSAAATTTPGRHSMYSYNGGGGGFRGAEVEDEELRGVYNYGKQWRPEDNTVSRFSDEYDPTAAAAAATTTEWREEVDPNNQPYTNGVNGGRDQFAHGSQTLRGNPDGYGVYNYGGRTGNYGGRGDGHGSGYEKKNSAAMDENGEEDDP